MSTQPARLADKYLKEVVPSLSKPPFAPDSL